jgi:ABC-type branched-subunit amino acid transport system substrate-binding protein
MMGVFGSDEAQVAAPYLEAHRVPFFDPIGGGVEIKGKRWIWQTEPDYVREGKVIANYVAEKLHAKRVAILYQVGVGEGQRDALKSTLRKDGPPWSPMRRTSQPTAISRGKSSACDRPTRIW